MILGLLLIAEQTLYQLVRSFEGGVSLFYSASAGSIKRALDGLLERGLIEVASLEPGARGRKVYRVTAAGQAEFRSWMTAELRGADVETAALSRLFFLGLLDPAERPSVLRRVTSRVEADLARLTDLAQRLDTADIADEHRAVAAFQRAPVEYGIAAHRFALDWFAEQLRSLET